MRAPLGRGGRTGQNHPRLFVWVFAAGEYPNEYPDGPFVYPIALGERVRETHTARTIVDASDKADTPSRNMRSTIDIST